jgi:hypothetical protein
MTPDPVEEVMWRDLRRMLDEEIYRLPTKYREAFVLCYLQGKTNEEAARSLGCPPGTVFTRLARGREMLRGRLTRRGIVLSIAGLASTITQEATARVPPTLVSSTIKAATLFAAGNVAAGLAASRHVLTLAHGALKVASVSKWLALTAMVCMATTLASAKVLSTPAVPEEITALSLESPVVVPEAPVLAPQSKQEPTPAGKDQPRDRDSRAHLVQEANGFGRGFGMSEHSAAAAAVVNDGRNSDSVTVNVTGSRKMMALTLPEVQRALMLSGQQRERVRELQKRQARALREVAPREPMDAGDAPKVLREVRGAARDVKKLAKEIDQAVDELLSEKQRHELGEMIPHLPHMP